MSKKPEQINLSSTNDSDQAKAWIEALNDKGITVRLKDGNLEMSPRSAYGTLTSDELLTLNDYRFRASIKSLLRNKWRPTDFVPSGVQSSELPASPQGRPNLPTPIDKAGTSFASQTSPHEAANALEASKPDDLSEATALTLVPPEKASVSLSPQELSTKLVLNSVVADDTTPDPERAAIINANTDEERKRRNAIATSIMLHGMPTGHKHWSS